MPNKILTAERIIPEAIPILRNTSTFYATVNTDAEAPLNSVGLGSSVAFPTPKPLVGDSSRLLSKINDDGTVDASTAGVGYTYNADGTRRLRQEQQLLLPKTSIDVRKECSSKVAMPAEWRTFELASWYDQLGARQLEHVSDVATQYFVDNAIRQIPLATGFDLDITDFSNVANLLTYVRRVLGRRKVQVATTTLWTRVGLGFAEQLLNQKILTDADVSGSDAALRDAIIGRLRGQNIIEDPFLNDFEVVTYERDAFGAALVAPVGTMNTENSAGYTMDGYSIGWRLGLNEDGTEYSNFVAYAAAGVLDEKRAVRFDFTSEVEGGTDLPAGDDDE